MKKKIGRIDSKSVFGLGFSRNLGSGRDTITALFSFMFFKAVCRNIRTIGKNLKMSHWNHRDDDDGGPNQVKRARNYLRFIVSGKIDDCTGWLIFEAYLDMRESNFANQPENTKLTGIIRYH